MANNLWCPSIYFHSLLGIEKRALGRAATYMDWFCSSPSLVCLVLLFLLFLSCVIGVVAPGRYERCLWTFPLVDSSLSPLPRVWHYPHDLDLLLTPIPSPTPITCLLSPSSPPPSPCVLLPPLLSSRQLLVTEIDWS